MYNSKGTEEAIHDTAWRSRIGDINKMHIDDRLPFTFVGYFQSKDAIAAIEGHT